MNKLKLFKNTYDKLCNDRAFMAFYLNEVSLKENRTLEEMTALLNCSVEDYYKLALCKAPEINEDFDLRIRKIAGYTNTSTIVLSNIISYSNGKQKTNTTTSQHIFLPHWLIRLQGFIYRTTVSICIIVLLVIGYVPQKNETKNIQLVANDYFKYADSIKYTQVQDNTFVYKSDLTKINLL